MAQKRGLGKGIDSLFSSNEVDINENDMVELSITQVEPDKNQPRKRFDNGELEVLAESIKLHGLIQPITVTKGENGTYIIVTGERRWRACKKLGLKKIPAFIKDYTEQEKREVSLIENLQRVDLNPIEEALGYRDLMESYQFTQEKISQRIGKSRSAIANSMRLLALEPEFQKHIISGDISEGHARAVLSLEGYPLREFLVNRIIEDGLNVRQAEKLAKELQKPKTVSHTPPTAYDIELSRIRESLESRFGTKVKITHKDKKGKIEIEYYGNEDLERILNLLK